MRQPNRPVVVGTGIGLLTLFLILAVTLRPIAIIVPAAEMFEGEVGGCGDFMVYRFNNGHTLAVSVQVDERKLTLTQGRAEIDLAQSRGNCFVEILQFRSSAPWYFCDCIGGDPVVDFTWKGITGQVAVQDDAPPDPTSLPCSAKHSVSVDLADVILENTKTKQRVRIERLRIANVRVGWCAG